MITYEILENDLVAGIEPALDPGRSAAVFATMLEEKIRELGYEVCGEIIPCTTGNVQNSGVSFTYNEGEDEDEIWNAIDELLSSDEWREEGESKRAREAWANREKEWGEPDPLPLGYDPDAKDYNKCE